MKNRAVISLIVYVLILGLLGYTAVFGVGSDKSGSASSIKLGLDLAGGVSITYQVVGDEEPDSEDMADTIYKLQQRVQNYSTEAQVYQEGSDRINIEIPGVSDANAILEELGKPGSLYFISQTDSEGNQNYTGTYGVDADGNIVMQYFLNKTIDEMLEDGSIVLTGTEVAGARAATQQVPWAIPRMWCSCLSTIPGRKRSRPLRRKPLTTVRRSLFITMMSLSACPAWRP